MTKPKHSVSPPSSKANRADETSRELDDRGVDALLNDVFAEERSRHLQWGLNHWDEIISGATTAAAGVDSASGDKTGDEEHSFLTSSDDCRDTSQGDTLPNQESIESLCLDEMNVCVRPAEVRQWLESLSQRIEGGRSRAVARFATQLAQGLACRDIGALVDVLLGVGRACGLTTVRFYSLENQGHTWAHTHFCSRAGAGHPVDVNRQLRGGEIVKFAATPMTESDSFWVAATRTPMAFVIDNRQAGDLKGCLTPECIPWMRLHDDPCGKILHHPAWVDFPLQIGGELVGKISCDIARPLEVRVGASGEWWLAREDGGPGDDQLVEGWLDFQRFVDALAAQIHWLFQRELQNTSGKVVLAELARQLEAAQTPRDAVTALGQSLGQSLGCDYGNVHTIEQDHFRGEVLVERCTWQQGAITAKNTQAYPVSELNDITGFVARGGQAMSLRDLGSETCVKKVEQYGRGIACTGIGLRPGDHVIAVKIPAVHRFRGAVLQLVQRGGNNQWQGERFLDVLEAFCQQQVAPRFEQLVEDIARENMERMQRKLDADEVFRHIRKSRKKFSHARLEDSLMDVAREMIGRMGLSSDWVCRILFKLGEHSFVHQWDGSLPVPDHQVFQSQETLTKYVMSQQQCVALHDLDYAEQIGHYRRDANAKSALACSLRCGAETFGAIVIESNSNDLTSALHGPMLTAFAHRAGALLAAYGHMPSLRDPRPHHRRQVTLDRTLQDTVPLLTCGMDQQYNALLARLGGQAAPVRLQKQKRHLLKAILWDACRIGWRMAPTVNIEADTLRDEDGRSWLTLGLTWPQADELAVCPHNTEFLESIASWKVGDGPEERQGKITEMSQNVLTLQLPLSANAIRKNVPTKVTAT